MLSTLSANDSYFKRLSFFHLAVCMLVFLLLCRVFAMYVVPLNDSTEARYGEIARIMLETGNWVTPMHNYGIPFWAKPPLSTWLSASSMQLFGVNELAVRLPGLLLSIGILWLIFNLAKKHSGSMVATVATVVLAGSIYFYLDSGTVMTDPALLFCTTLMLVSFWGAVVNQSKGFGYLFFIGAGLGLLAKGPVALVLTGMPIFIWVLRHKQWRALWQNLPWIKGSLVMLAIALPWYYLAEMRTPGFLNYFIVGEHIKRFLQPGWNGDLYGFAHTAPYGMIWVYALMGIFPWSIPGAVWLTRHVKKLPSLCKDQDGWMSYLLLCTFIPLLFFTFARNIIYPYVFPSLPTFALLFAELTSRSHVSVPNQRRLLTFSVLSGCVFLLLTTLFIAKPEWVAKSQDRVVAVFEKQHPTTASRLVYWTNKTDYSAQFYSKGMATAIRDPQVLCQFLSNPVRNYVVLETKNKNQIPSDMLAQLTEITTIPVLKQRFSIYSSNAMNCS